MESGFGVQSDQPQVNAPYSSLLACLSESSICVRSPTPITLKISRSMSASSSVSARERLLFLPLGCPAGFSLTAAVVSFGGLPRLFPVVVALVFDLPRRLPVSPNDALVLLTRVGPIVPFIPAASHASFTALTLPCGWSPRNSFTKLVLPWFLVAVAML